MGQTIPKFKGGGDLWVELKRRVDEYFAVNKLKKTGDWRLYSKTIILLLSLSATYYFLVFLSFPAWIRILGCALVGVLSAGIGFCIMHDANHGGYSKSKTWNHFLGLSLNLLGGNSKLWKIKHGDIHHTNTNTDGYDEDIEAQPVLRLHPNQEWLPIHRYQHKVWYWASVYSLLYIAWIWWNDYKKYFTGRIMHKRGIKFSRSEHVTFWVSKAFYITMFVVIPIVFVGFWPWLIGYAVVMVTCSFLIALVFQLAHVVEEVEQPTINNTRERFAEHQIATTSDFATRSSILTWYLGGLNYQVEHHLFPYISHVHYPVIHKIVKSVCEEAGTVLHEHDTFAQAVRSHIAELRFLGVRPMVAV